jgi:hypothetical protein
MNPYIFIDLDETLIHTFEDWENPTPDAVQINIDTDTYNTSLRPGALEFLKQMRDTGDVFMLTIAYTQYALKMNEVFNLGFQPSEIYARENIQDEAISLPPRDRVFLFDNLPRRENRLKIEFLRAVSTKGNPFYIQAKEYRGHQDMAIDQEYADWISKAIDQNE